MRSDCIPTVLILHRMLLRPDCLESRKALCRGLDHGVHTDSLASGPCPLESPSVSLMVMKYLLYWTLYRLYIALYSLNYIARDQGPQGLNEEPIFLKHPLTHLFLEHGGTVDRERARSQEEEGGEG